MTGPSETDAGGTRRGTDAMAAPPDATRTEDATPAGQRTETGPSPAAPEGAVPRAGAARPPSPADPGPGWAPGAGAPVGRPPGETTTVLPGAAGGAGAAATAARRSAPPRPAGVRPGPRLEPRPVPSVGARPLAARTRRARLSLRRIDPWSVFLFSLVASVFLGIALVVAVAVLYAVLTRLGVTASLNELYAEVTGGSATEEPLLTSGRIVGGAAVLAAVNVVFLTLLATLGSLLYNLCASFTGGIEVTLGERD